MAGLKDRLKRRWLPRLVVALARRIGLRDARLEPMSAETAR